MKYDHQYKKGSDITLLRIFVYNVTFFFDLGGILLGPSGIGRHKPFLDRIFPTYSLPLLSIVANVGLVLYLFIVGMELDPNLLVSNARKAGGIAFLGMAVPFALGVAISDTIFQNLQGAY